MNCLARSEWRIIVWGYCSALDDFGREKLLGDFGVSVLEQIRVSGFLEVAIFVSSL